MTVEQHVVNTPEWIAALVEDVIVPAVVPFSFIGTLGYRYWRPDDPTNEHRAWVLAVYPTSNEIVGPCAGDGATATSGFRLNVAALTGAMTDVESVVWECPARYNGTMDGPEISVRGRYAGNTLVLRFFHLPPPDEPPSFRVNPTTGEVRELPA